MPSYIFLEPVPLLVTYRGTEYRFQVKQVMHNIWRLEAVFGKASWFIADRGDDATLMKDMHVSGFEVNARTVPDGIMQQLVKEGRARALP
jgi:hypothetical protein